MTYAEYCSVACRSRRMLAEWLKAVLAIVESIRSDDPRNSSQVQQYSYKWHARAATFERDYIGRATWLWLYTTITDSVAWLADWVRRRPHSESALRLLDPLLDGHPNAAAETRICLVLSTRIGRCALKPPPGSARCTAPQDLGAASNLSSSN